MVVLARVGVMLPSAACCSTQGFQPRTWTALRSDFTVGSLSMMALPGRSAGSPDEAVRSVSVPAVDEAIDEAVRRTKKLTPAAEGEFIVGGELPLMRSVQLHEAAL